MEQMKVRRGCTLGKESYLQDGCRLEDLQRPLNHGMQFCHLQLLFVTPQPGQQVSPVRDHELDSPHQEQCPPEQIIRW